LKVFHSTVNFFETTHEALQLQPFSRADFEEMVFELYELIIKDYERLKSLIPKNNLVEIRYEDFESDPLNGLRDIYNSLDLPGFEESVVAFTSYFDSQKKFEKANHPYDPIEIERIHKRWGFAMELYGYS
jgi:hypothetical protein